MRAVRPAANDSPVIPLGPRAVLLGLSGPEPGLHLWPDLLRSLPGQSVASTNSVYSVYGVAVSPEASYLAWGHRSGQKGFGGGEVYSISTTGASHAKVLGSHRGGCFSVSFLTENLLVSGGGDGKIRFWDLSLDRQVNEALVNRRCVFAVRALSPRLLAVLSADEEVGGLSLWDLDSLAVRYEGPPVRFPYSYGLLDITFCEEDRRLYHPCVDGSIASYTIEGSTVSHEIHPRHVGSFYGLCFGKEIGLVSAGFEDHTIKVGPLGGPVYEMRAAGGVLLAGFVPPDFLLLCDKERRVQVWRWVDRGLEHFLTLPGWDVRALAGMPLKALVVWKEQMSSARRNDLLAQIEPLRRSKDWEKLHSLATELEGVGLIKEAWTVRAQAAEDRGQPLKRLQALVALERLLPCTSPALGDVRYHLGVLLESLDEPEEALSRYRSVGESLGRFGDLEERIHRLEGIPLAASGSQVLREDLKQSDAFVQHVRQASILGKTLNGLFPLSDPIRPILFPERPLLENSFLISPEFYAQSGLTPWVEGPVEGISCKDRKRERARWLLMVAKEDEFAESHQGVAVAVVVAERWKGTTLSPLVVLDVSRCGIEDSDPSVFNRHLESKWRFLRESGQVKDWYESVCLGIHKALEDRLRRTHVGRAGNPLKDYEVLP